MRVEDRNESNAFPVGKQRNGPSGLFYTGASGIWQTVWMEPVPVTHLDKLEITPDLTSFNVTPKISGAGRVRAEVVVSKPTGEEVARSSGKPGQTLRIAGAAAAPLDTRRPVPLRPQGPAADPSGDVVDEASSYAGLRTIGVVNDPQGRPRIALNGKITFLHGPLGPGILARRHLHGAHG